MTEEQFQDFMGCPFFEESTNDLKTHEKLSRKNESVLCKHYEIFGLTLADIIPKEENILAPLQKLHREQVLLQSKVQRAEQTNNELHSECNLLHSQVKEKNNEMPLLAQEADILKKKLQELQIDENEKKSELELRHKSVLLTKDTYKKWAGCHVRLLKSDDQGSTLVFKFENSGPGSTEILPPRSAKFSYSSKREWKLLETNPSLSNFEKLSKRLSESQDIQGLLAHLKSTLKSQTRQRIKSKEN